MALGKAKDSVDDNSITVFRNCTLLRNSKWYPNSDVWVRGGKIVDPSTCFYKEKVSWKHEYDCDNAYLAPGLIDLQVNGGFGVDFTNDICDEKTANECLTKVGSSLLAYGVTSFCPTLVSTDVDSYKTRLIPHMKRRKGGVDHGAEILGLHCEGPFISREKRGAHDEKHVKSFVSGKLDDLENIYGKEFDSNVSIVTLAPELNHCLDAIATLVSKGITVSMGHSLATLSEGERAFKCGASMVTHLFNAMNLFHHRDPGLLGLLSSKSEENDAGSSNFESPPPLFYYGLIADKIHTHPTALGIAYKTNYKSMCLISDGISAMGLPDGPCTLGGQQVEIRGGDRCTLKNNPDILCGAIVPLWNCVLNMVDLNISSLSEALDAASLHPAKALKIDDRKGSLNFGCDADFIIIRDANQNPDQRDSFCLQSTWIAGKMVYSKC